MGVRASINGFLLVRHEVRCVFRGENASNRASAATTPPARVGDIMGLGFTAFETTSTSAEILGRVPYAGRSGIAEILELIHFSIYAWSAWLR